MVLEPWEIIPFKRTHHPRFRRVGPHALPPDTIDFYALSTEIRDFLVNLEQVYVRGKNLQWVAGLGMALAIAVLPAAAAAAQNVATATTLNIIANSPAQATAIVTVIDESGLPAAGAVDIVEGSRILTEAPLNSAGQATATVTLPTGSHELHAVYSGDASHRASTSPVVEQQSDSGTTPDYAVSLAPVSPTSFPMVLKAGTSGTAQVTLTPQNNASLTAPMFVTLSCSGLPNQSSCTFTPATVEILPTTPTSCSSGAPASACPPVSSMLLQTVAGSTVRSSVSKHTSSPIAWAFLLPGVLGLGGLAWSTRRRAWLSRLALVALLGVVATLGATGCAPLYRYYQHGPGDTPATPAGTYTVIVTAQSNNGVSAITNNTTLVLTVQ